MENFAKFTLWCRDWADGTSDLHAADIPEIIPHGSVLHFSPLYSLWCYLISAISLDRVNYLLPLPTFTEQGESGRGSRDTDLETRDLNNDKDPASVGQRRVTIILS